MKHDSKFVALWFHQKQRLIPNLIKLTHSLAQLMYMILIAWQPASFLLHALVKQPLLPLATVHLPLVWLIEPSLAKHPLQIQFVS